METVQRHTPQSPDTEHPLGRTRAGRHLGGRRPHALILALVVVMALPVTLPTARPAPGASAANESRFKTISRTFSNPAEINIGIEGPANPYPSSIRVSGFRQGRIKDVNVTLKVYQHTFPDDVDILLVSPGGRRAFIVSEVGHNANLFDNGGVTITLDDEAAQPLPDFGQIVSGRFQPTNGDPDLPTDESGDAFPSPAPQPTGSRLSVFDGTDPNGTWRLFVVDDRSSDGGLITEGWSLRITSRVTLPKRR